jgi:hypothetical protein
VVNKVNLTFWAEQQKAALIDAGVNPLDAETAVQWVVDNLPPGADPDTWLPAQQAIIDAVRSDKTGALVDAKAYWYSSDDVPARYNTILNAQPVADEEEGREVGRDVAVGVLLWLFLRNQGRYATAKPFRPAAQRSIRTLLDGTVAAEERNISGTITAYHEGDIAPAVWHRHTQAQLQRLHLNYRALGGGGYAMLSDNDYLSIDAELMSDYAYLHGFAEDIRDGNSTIAQSQARGGLYVGNARIHYWAALGAAMAYTAMRDEVLLERRVLGATRQNCKDCLDMYDQGWQYDGTLPEPGIGSQCRRNCRCSKVYTTVAHTEMYDWIGTKRNANRSR